MPRAAKPRPFPRPPGPPCPWARAGRAERRPPRPPALAAAASDEPLLSPPLMEAISSLYNPTYRTCKKKKKWRKGSGAVLQKTHADPAPASTCLRGGGDDDTSPPQWPPSWLHEGRLLLKHGRPYRGPFSCSPPTSQSRVGAFKGFLQRQKGSALASPPSPGSHPGSPCVLSPHPQTPSFRACSAASPVPARGGT